MEKKYLDRIKEMSEIKKTFDGCNDIYPPSQKSVESLKVVLEMLDDLDMIDRIDPYNDIYPDNDGGVEIKYNLDNYDDYYVEIDVKDNFIVLYDNVDGSYEYDERMKVIPLSGTYFKPVKIAHKIAEYISYAQCYADGVGIDCPLRPRWASIRIDIHDGGLRFTCYETGQDTFIDAGDVDTLLNKLNNVCDICDPDATFCLTELGEKVLKQIQDDENERGK